MDSSRASYPPKSSACFAFSMFKSIVDAEMGRIIMMPKNNICGCPENNCECPLFARALWVPRHKLTPSTKVYKMTASTKVYKLTILKIFTKVYKLTPTPPSQICKVPAREPSVTRQPFSAKNRQPKFRLASLFPAPELRLQGHGGLKCESDNSE